VKAARGDRQRAIQAEDKQERHHAILDAAARLLLRSPERIANMADVADEAGLAKGTVYLYFPSKEELLLAVHERNIDGFFRASSSGRSTTTPVAVTDCLALTHEHMVEPPLFLPLAARCFGLMGQSVPAEAAHRVQAAHGERLMAAARPRAHFPELEAGGGVALLRHSYALIIGLWQMSAESAGTLGCPMAPGPGEVPPVFSFRLSRRSSTAALLALWNGTMGEPAMNSSASLLVVRARPRRMRREAPPQEVVRPVQLTQVAVGNTAESAVFAGEVRPAARGRSRLSHRRQDRRAHRRRRRSREEGTGARAPRPGGRRVGRPRRPRRRWRPPRPNTGSRRRSSSATRTLRARSSSAHPRSTPSATTRDANRAKYEQAKAQLAVSQNQASYATLVATRTAWSRP
jgi:AcrR family transcriptional regulator